MVLVASLRGLVGLWGFCLGFGGVRTWTHLLDATHAGKIANESSGQITITSWWLNQPI